VAPVEELGHLLDRGAVGADFAGRGDEESHDGPQPIPPPLAAKPAERPFVAPGRLAAAEAEGRTAKKCAGGVRLR
jgi:hypothetical protein